MTPAAPRSSSHWIKRHLWHPFTPMREWCAPGHDPLILVSGHGATLRDSAGREYIDGNSSIWTNIHGHNHPLINEAIRAQLDRVAHTSFLGFTNPPAIELAQRAGQHRRAGDALPRFFLGRWLHRHRGRDQDGPAILPGSRASRSAPDSSRLSVVTTATLLAPPALAESAFSRGASRGIIFRWCAWLPLAELEALPEPETIAAVVIEPLIQGAAGMRPWPSGLLAGLRQWCDRRGALLIADEVMTGFGRTGTMFAFQQEKAVPDFLALAKGLTGGYLPLAATLVTESIFQAFQGETFYYGHSYCGNQLGCAAALASLRLFAEENVLDQLQPKIDLLRMNLDRLRANPRVREVRQCGFIAGIEIGAPDGAPPDPVQRAGARVCMAARRHGLLTRPILDTVVLMPPLCVTPAQIDHACRAVEMAIEDVCG